MRYHRFSLFCGACLCFAVCLLFCGCTAQGATPYAVLCSLQETQQELPAGACYVLSAAPDEETYPTESLLAVLFGNGSLPAAFEEIEDGAFFFSYSDSCELAVFRCKGSRGREAVTKMCLDRLQYLKSVHPDRESEALQSATVTVRGKWVLLCICEDPDATARAFRRAVG